MERLPGRLRGSGGNLQDQAERMQELENARKEQEKLAGRKDEIKVNKRVFRVG